MNFWSWDVESHLIRPGLAAPRLVCVSATDGENDPVLLLRDDGLQLVLDKLRDDSTIMLGHQTFYDLGVVCAEDPSLFVPLVFRALEMNRIRDTIVRQQLLDIATGQLKYRWDAHEEEYRKTGYSLDDLALRLLGRVLQKEGTWRLRFALLDGVPLAAWPEDAKKYAIDDAVTTWDVFWEQAWQASGPDGGARETVPDAVAAGGTVPTEERAVREAWALWLMSAWGIRTDAEAVAKLKVELEAEHAAAIEKLVPTGIYKQKRDGSYSKHMAAIYARVIAGFAAQGRLVPVTGGGKPSTDFDTLLASGDPDLKVLADSSKGAKLLSTYVPMLEHGCTHAICARFNVLVESNRTSCSKPNLQNPPRKGGVRACFVARAGYVYCSCDYDTIELRSLAQTCLDLVKHSAMADALRKGEDLHLNLAASFMGITREEAKARYDAGDVEVSDMRQMMKPANFGFPGGMASDSFVEYAAGMGVKIDSGLAKRIHEQWKREWPEMGPYFALVADTVGSANEGVVASPRSGFVRGGLRFTQLANHFFQSLTATGAKDALWHVTRECYNDPKSPLWGSRPVIFMHDEILTEMPEDRAHEAAERQSQIMVEVMQRWIPDIPIKSGPVLFRRWHKGAKAVRVDGRLVPSKPVEVDGKVKWAADL